MREHLFRGKTVNDGKWVEGSLLVDERNNSYIGVLLQPKGTAYFMTGGRTNGKTLNRFIGVGFVMVNPETVGQWTGLVDKNDVKIFEGDVIHYSNDVTYEVLWHSTELRYWVRGLDYKDEDGLSNLYETESRIIGNIHDNPELLEVTE